MLDTLSSLVSPDVFKVFLTLFLSFLIGLEREDHKSNSGDYAFGGIRTFPLIGLTGFALAYLSDESLIPFTAGFLVVGGLMMLSFKHKLSTTKSAGMTSEVAGLTTYVLGALVFYEHYWLSSTIAILGVLLLELKDGLGNLVKKFPRADVVTFTKFLVLTIVILPIVPNQNFGPYEFNPFKMWLIVVAVSTISYGSYLLQLWAKGRGGIALSALLGGAYSSTATTVSLARQSAGISENTAFAGGILMASGVMYLRIVILLALFNPSLPRPLSYYFLFLSAGAICFGWFWISQKMSKQGDASLEIKNQNPLALSAACIFAALFVGMLILTYYTLQFAGNAGVVILAAIMGTIDVDPFILGISQSTGQGIDPMISSMGICVAASSNNIMKGIYALFFSRNQTGKKSLIFLIILAVLGLLPLFFL